MKKMKNCAQVEKNMGLYVSSDLPQLELEAARLHILDCAPCRCCYEEFHSLRQRLQSLRDCEIPEEVWSGYWPEIKARTFARGRQLRPWIAVPMPLALAAAAAILIVVTWFLPFNILEREDAEPVAQDGAVTTETSVLEGPESLLAADPNAPVTDEEILRWIDEYLEENGQMGRERVEPDSPERRPDLRLVDYDF